MPSHRICNYINTKKLVVQNVLIVIILVLLLPPIAIFFIFCLPVFSISKSL